MKRSASETIRNLEMRIARLEKSASETLTSSERSTLQMVLKNANALMGIMAKHGLDHGNPARVTSTTQALGLLLSDINAILRD